MHRLRRPLPIVLALLAVITLAGTARAQNDSAAMTWYTGGAAKLNLAPIPLDTPAGVVLSGSTTQKTLLVTVAKHGGNPRSNPIPLAADGSFDLIYLIKDGNGSYTLTFLGSEQPDALSYQGLGFVTLAIRQPLPADLRHRELNDRILAFVDQAMGSTVGRGECWDLAQAALDTNLADWIRPTGFGRLLDPANDAIKAGDIIQFRSLKITEQLPDNVTRTETLGAPDHTAVIYRVQGPKHYTLAHQNVGGTRKVMKSEINLAHVTSGRYWIYRPVALMIRP